jgi:hypothetical protein
LDTGKVYTRSDADWETIKKEHLSIAGSSVLRNGKAVWTIRSLKNESLSFEFETRVQSGDVVYVKSPLFTLSPESKFPSFTLLASSRSLTPKTVRADDSEGIRILFQSDNAPSSVDVDITDYVTNKNILSLRSVPVTQKTLKIGSPAANPVLHKAGKYIVTLRANGLSEKIDLFIVAGSPQKLITNIPKIVLAKEKYVANFSITDEW